MMYADSHKSIFTSIPVLDIPVFSEEQPYTGCFFYMLTHLSFHYSKTTIVTVTTFITIQLDYGGRVYSKSQLIS